jgi:hypothetical protein
MGTRNGPYNADFPAGTRVQVAQRSVLEEFLHEWTFHHPLDRQQLDFAGQLATVKDVSYYHGGDELYSLIELPGIWHEVCLQPAANDRAA